MASKKIPIKSTFHIETLYATKKRFASLDMNFPCTRKQHIEEYLCPSWECKLLFPRAVKVSVIALMQQQQQQERKREREKIAKSSWFTKAHEHSLFCSGCSWQCPFKYTGNLAEKQRLQDKFLLLGMLFWSLSYQPRTNTVKQLSLQKRS